VRGPTPGPDGALDFTPRPRPCSPRFAAPRGLRASATRRPLLLALLVTLGLGAAAPAGAASRWWGFTTRVSTRDFNVHRLDVSGVRVTVRGDGDTDLDCYLYDVRVQ